MTKFNTALTIFLSIVSYCKMNGQYTWKAFVNDCSNIEVFSNEPFRKEASILLYEKHDGLYKHKKSLRLNKNVYSVTFSELLNSIYRVVVIFDHTYEESYPLWNIDLNTSSDIVIDCNQTRNKSSKEITMELIPNPATNSVTIYIEDNTNETRHIKIYSIDGRMLNTFSFTGKNLDVPLQGYNSGEYFIVCNVNNSTLTNKLIKK